MEVKEKGRRKGRHGERKGWGWETVGAISEGAT